MATHLCIGGPLHGQEITPNDGNRHVATFRCALPSPFEDDGALSGFKQATYVGVPFECGGSVERVYFFPADELPPHSHEQARGEYLAAKLDAMIRATARGATGHPWAAMQKATA